MALSLSVAACSGPQRSASPPPGQVPAFTPPPGARVYEVQPQASQMRILVYRGGALAQAGHNHVISSQRLSGRAYWHRDLSRSGFELSLPVGTLIVDEPAARREEGAPFADTLSEAAQAGTRQNMLGEALLDVQRYPIIRMSGSLSRAASGQLIARLRVRVKDAWRELPVPIELERKDDRLVAAGEFSVRQTELGLTPFSALLGALRVQDEMKVKFRIVAVSGR